MFTEAGLQIHQRGQVRKTLMTFGSIVILRNLKLFLKMSCYHGVGGKCFSHLLSRSLSRLIAYFSEDSRGLVQATQKADKQYQSHTGLVTVHPSHFLHNSSCSHLHAAEHLELTRHLWYADGTATAAVAPFSQSFDLNEVGFSSGDLKLHTGFIGL